MRKFAQSRNSSRKISLHAMVDPFAEHMTNYYPVYCVFFTVLSACTVVNFFVLRSLLIPIERQLTELNQEMKQGFDKLEMKIDMEIDRLSKETKESNDKINSRDDSNSLRSLDSQRVPKSSGE